MCKNLSISSGGSSVSPRYWLLVARGKKEPTDAEIPADTKYIEKEKGPFLSSRWRYTRMAITWLLILLFVSSGADKLVDIETKNMTFQQYLRQIEVDDKAYYCYAYLHTLQ